MELPAMMESGIDISIAQYAAGSGKTGERAQPYTVLKKGIRRNFRCTRLGKTVKRVYYQLSRAFQLSLRAI